MNTLEEADCYGSQERPLSTLKADLAAGVYEGVKMPQLGP